MLGLAKKKSKLHKRLISAIWFLVKLNLFAIPLYIIIFYNLNYLPFQVATASMTNLFLNSVGYNFLQDGNILAGVVGDTLFTVEISWDSTGWKSLYVIAALALATPGIVLRKKLLFIAFALPSIFAINFIRIITTLLVSFNFGMEYFEFVHQFLWSAGMIVAVLAIWAYWLQKKRIISFNTKFILGRDG